MSDIEARLVLGHVTMRAWFELRPDGTVGAFIGMGELCQYNRDGTLFARLVEPTGAVLCFTEPTQPKRGFCTWLAALLGCVE